jgi:hypothetical protein
MTDYSRPRVDPAASQPRADADPFAAPRSDRADHGSDPVETDPFGADPFGADPFGSNAAGAAPFSAGPATAPVSPPHRASAAARDYGDPDARDYGTPRPPAPERWPGADAEPHRPPAAWDRQSRPPAQPTYPATPPRQGHSSAPQGYSSPAPPQYQSRWGVVPNHPRAGEPQPHPAAPAPQHYSTSGTSQGYGAPAAPHSHPAPQSYSEPPTDTPAVTAAAPSRPAKPPRPDSGQSPAAVFWAAQLMFGVAASILVMAIAGFFAMPELTQYYSQLTHSTTAGHVRLLGFGLIGLTILVTGAAGWLGLIVGGGQTRTRLFSWVMCGVVTAGAATVLVLSPWEVVPWFGMLLQIAAAVVAMLAVAAAVLLSQPLSGGFFRSPSDIERDESERLLAEAKLATMAPGGLVSAAPAAPSAVGPTTPPVGPADYDPFT